MTINQIRIRVGQRLNELNDLIPIYNNKYVNSTQGSIREENWHAKHILACQERDALKEVYDILSKSCKSIKF